MYQTTSAIILKKVPYGEADLIVTFFGREEGRLSGIAKNARASLKRFGGSLELGSIVDLRYSNRHSSNIVRIDDSHVQIPVVGIMQSLERIAAMSKALELAIAFLPERQSAPEKFDLLAQHISALTSSDPTPSLLINFELNWLSYAGYKPQLEHCMSCGGSGHDGGIWSFSVDHGGIFCQGCIGLSHHRIDLKNRTLQGMQRLSIENDSPLDQEDSRIIQNLLVHYTEHILGRPLLGRMITQRW